MRKLVLFVALSVAAFGQRHARCLGACKLSFPVLFRQKLLHPTSAHGERMPHPVVDRELVFIRGLIHKGFSQWLSQAVWLYCA